MKGKKSIFLVGLAIILGAGSVLYMDQKINQKEELITVLKSDKISLEKDKASLEKDKKDLTVKLGKAGSDLKSTKTALSELSNDHYKALKEMEVQRQVEKDLMEEISAKDEKISALNGELQTAQNKNRDYDSQITTLNSQMLDKDREIDDIGRRLKSTEEDRDHLLLEQKKLIAEKAELEKQFQDILVLRKKVQQLQVELMASKKLEWLRRGFYGGARKKGGSQLMSMRKKNDRKTISTNADLNVEVRRDGTVKIVPIETNSPPSRATP
jgi:chromosome segregation ATPase